MKSVEICGWKCSDPDCCQYYCERSFAEFSYAEIRRCGDERHVPIMTVNVRDYSWKQIEDYCSGYYTSLEEIVKQYGFDHFFHIVSECIFEQTPESEAYVCGRFYTEEEAEKFLEEWILEYGRLYPPHEGV